MSFTDSSLWMFVEVAAVVTVVVLSVVGIWNIISRYLLLRRIEKRVEAALMELKVALSERYNDPRGKARLAIAEEEYNKSVKLYNQQVTLIQSYFMGKIFKVKRKELFKSDELKKS